MFNKVIAVVILSILLTGCAPTDAQIQEAIAKTQAAMPTATYQPIVRPTKVPTQVPTKTPKPTATVKPTEVVYPPMDFTGSGDDIVTFPTNLVGEFAVLEITYESGGNFIVWLYNSNNEKEDLIVNVIGHYKGRVMINAEDDASGAMLQVESNGPWTIRWIYLKDFDNQHFAYVPGSYSGTGDDVVLISGTTSTATITHNGSGNFAVWAYSTSGRDLLVNEIGNYSGKQILPSELVIITVSADGNWEFIFE